MGDTYLAEARSKSLSRLELFAREVAVAESLIGDKGTIFATGSYGRLEANEESDLDVFIVIKSKGRGASEAGKPSLDQTRQIRLKNEIIVAAEKAGMAEFDAGGKFLETHLYDDIVEEVGSPSDDFKNTFTGRMLLILESRPLIGENVYLLLRKDAIYSYFHDFEGNEGEFVPFFLINDILRMWRTFCVNYEFFRKGTSDWRIKNLKLKYTRMLTCFSAVLYIAAIYRLSGAVTPKDIEEMSSFTPIERMQQFSTSGRFSGLIEIDFIKDLATSCITDYAEFLAFVQEKKAAMSALKADEDTWRDRSHDFGAKMATLLHAVSGEDPLANRLYRSVLV